MTIYVKETRFSLPTRNEFSAEVDIRFRECNSKGARDAGTYDRIAGPYLELSITAIVKHRKREFSGGQCHPIILEHWGDIPEVRRLVEIWERWHLNCMRAGTTRQMALLRGLPPKPGDWYDNACRDLQAAGLLVHNGYRFGNAWLYERLPDTLAGELDEIVTAIEKL